MKTKSWLLRRSQRELMACEDIIVCLEALPHFITQVSLGLLPTGDVAALSAAECTACSRGIARNIGRNV
jgi:hypothetical protein